MAAAGARAELDDDDAAGVRLDDTLARLDTSLDALFDVDGADDVPAVIVVVAACVGVRAELDDAAGV